MVYLPLEPVAAAEAIQLSRKTGYAVWVGSDAITEEQHRQLTRDGISITRFVYPLATATNEDVAGALSTIEEHHPGEVVWVQHNTASRNGYISGSYTGLTALW